LLIYTINTVYIVLYQLSILYHVLLYCRFECTLCSFSCPTLVVLKHTWEHTLDTSCSSVVCAVGTLW